MSTNHKNNNFNLVALVGAIPLAPYIINIIVQSILSGIDLLNIVYIIIALFPSFYLAICIRDALKNPVEKQYLPLFITTLLHIFIFLITFIFQTKASFFYTALFGAITFTIIFAIIIKRYTMPTSAKKGKRSK